jgi:hypothetical protein
MTDAAFSTHLASGCSLSLTGCGAGMTELRYLIAGVITNEIDIREDKP